MSIRKYITKKNVIIGAAIAGTAIVGGIVALVINHNKKKAEIDNFLDDEDDEYDLDFFEYEELDDDDDDTCAEGNRCCEYAEQILRELENGTYGK